MKKCTLILFIVVICFSVIDSSCKKKESGTGSETSSYGSTNSHNVGSDCMKCHNSGGSNEFWWNVAGTVFKPDSVSLNPGCTVYLFNGPNGSGNLILSLPVDKKSNFYTTNSVSFGTGLYAEVKSSSGEIRYMPSPVTNGDCNYCHTKAMPILVN